MLYIAGCRDFDWSAIQKGYEMGIFDKKYCDFCGNKIGLLGNKKLEDGNMCKDCAGKLSPWFSDRRHSTKSEIQDQLNYREENRLAVSAFHTTHSIGRYYKLLLDEDHHKFIVTNSTNLESANPDVLDFDQITGCNLNIDEHRQELKHTSEEGKQISFDPPQYEYSYNFRVALSVNHPFIDEIRYSLSNGFIKTGERPAADTFSAWQFSPDSSMNPRIREYYDYLKMGNMIHEITEQMRLGLPISSAEIPSDTAPDTIQDEMSCDCNPVEPSDFETHVRIVCPWCGSATVSNPNGFCEFCGGSLNA